MRVVIVLEKVYEGFPGEGYEAGAECENAMRTEKGWYGRTPQEALARFIVSKAEGMANLANALHEDGLIQQAAIQHLGTLMGWDTLTTVGPRTVYEVAREFGVDRIDRVERELAEARREIERLRGSLS